MRGLDRTDVKKALKVLRQLGIKPPRVGTCVKVRPHVELCRHPLSSYMPGGTGYVVAAEGPHGLFGARRRRRRRSRR